MRRTLVVVGELDAKRSVGGIESARRTPVSFELGLELTLGDESETGLVDEPVLIIGSPHRCEEPAEFLGGATTDGGDRRVVRVETALFVHVNVLGDDDGGLTGRLVVGVARRGSSLLHYGRRTILASDNDASTERGLAYSNID
jgi:hypothetical protein